MTTFDLPLSANIASPDDGAYILSCTAARHVAMPLRELNNPIHRSLGNLTLILRRVIGRRARCQSF